MRTVAIRGKRRQTALDEAAVWEEGARGEFTALLDLVRADPYAEGLEQLLMTRLAVVGAAVMKSLGARRAAAGASVRTGRSGGGSHPRSRARRST